MAYFEARGPTVRLDRDIPASTCITPIFPWNAPEQPCSIPTPKSTFASTYKLKLSIQATQPWIFAKSFCTGKHTPIS